MLTIRLARKGDCLNVFNLSNRNYVRENSFNSGKIIWENHIKWFARAITDETIKFFIIEDTEFIGQVRLNINDNNAVISVSLLKEFWHKGIAFHVLQKIMAENNYHYLAQVKKNNIPSIKLFERLGFVKRKEEADKNYYEYEWRNTLAVGN